jgi:hypothetical protein
MDHALAKGAGEDYTGDPGHITNTPTHGLIVDFVARGPRPGHCRGIAPLSAVQPPRDRGPIALGPDRGGRRAAPDSEHRAGLADRVERGVRRLHSTASANSSRIRPSSRARHGVPALHYSRRPLADSPRARLDNPIP